MKKLLLLSSIAFSILFSSCNNDPDETFSAKETASQAKSFTITQQQAKATALSFFNSNNKLKARAA